MQYKICNKCLTSKSLDSFHKLKRSKDGHRAYCKTCASERGKERYLENKDYAPPKEKSKFLEDRAANYMEKWISVHKGKYSYDKVVFVESHVKVEIFCPAHNIYFWQTPNSHSSGNGCPECAKERRRDAFKSNIDKWVQKAVKVHGDRYDYSESVYETEKVKMLIRCNTCNTRFPITPDSHTATPQGGCPCCMKTGYNPLKAGHLYVLTCGDITKIGITNIGPEKRAKGISTDFGAEFAVIHSWKFLNGYIPDEMETTLLRQLRSQYKRPTDKFDGSTECFFNVDHSLLLANINNEIGKYSDYN